MSECAEDLQETTMAGGTQCHAHATLANFFLLLLSKPLGPRMHAHRRTQKHPGIFRARNGHSRHRGDYKNNRHETQDVPSASPETNEEDGWMLMISFTFYFL